MINNRLFFAALRTLFLYLCCFSAHPSYSSAACDEINKDCAEIGDWNLQLAMGLGVRTNPIVNSDNVSFAVIPQISYYGKRFFINNLDLGFTLLDKDKHVINLLFSPSFDSVYFDQSDPGNIFPSNLLTTSGGNAPATFNNAYPSVASPTVPRPNGDPTPSAEFLDALRLASISIDDLPERDFSYMGGLEYAIYYDQYEFQFVFLTDVNNTHGGQSFRALFNRHIYAGKTEYSFAAGLHWKSGKYHNYYYGLQRIEIEDWQVSYTPSSGITTLLRFGARKLINDKWSWQTTIQYEDLPSTVSNSPIVTESNSITAFTGAIYDF